VLIKQLFETTIYDSDSNLEGRFVVVPRLAYGSMPENIESFHILAEKLGLQMEREIRPSGLAYGLARCFLNEDPEFHEMIQGKRPVSPEFVESVKFSEVLAFAPVVPFQRNPLNLEALASVITGATGVGLGAFAGFVIGGGSPLIFVTVPAGMIIFGAAAGVARALEEGLRDRLERMIKGT
jgi:hypothetical protein